ncbi:putative isoform cra a protein [Neofusicoccum parvum]|uniref:Isoform cra a protein n=2 Tax=Neofusicoccum parvum TaxID=310453 RepID=A0ACB5S1V5_9PEZI|nr:putative isoform cra a protein [Neofusicoccum parvum UCRNP2]GME26782.1 putative isoform cra a protein [Neofusicoccum parvum]GME63150.1 putative isoform cra a protein [Neofusicoccum parvum]
MHFTSASVCAALILAASAAPAQLPTHKSAKGGVVELSGSRVQERSAFELSDISKPFEDVSDFLTGNTDKEDNEKRAPIDWDDVKKPFESVGDAITGNTEKNADKRSPIDWDDVKKPFESVGDAITGNTESKKEKRAPFGWDDVKTGFENVGNFLTGNSNKDDGNEKRDLPVGSLIKSNPLYDTDVEDLVEGSDK